MIKNIKANTDYIKVLELFYSYFGGLERKINAIRNLNLPDYSDRRKKDDIAADILSLGGTVPALTPDEHLPQIDDELQALGALYVMEGSTLGGLHIAKMIAANLNLQNGTSLAFFNGYGDQTDAMWESFKHSLDTRITDPEDQSKVIRAANDTFLGFRKWIELTRGV